MKKHNNLDERDEFIRQCYQASPFFANYFCLIPNTNYAFVAISKNAVTTLKQVTIYMATKTWLEDEILIHNTLGYKESEYLVPVFKMNDYEKQHGTYVKFAIWRDPIERIESVYRLFCLENEFRWYFHYLGLSIDKSWEHFKRFLYFEWEKKEPLFIDEHIRKQSDYYKQTDVDYIIPIYKINQFLEYLHLPVPDKKANETIQNFRITDLESLNKIKQYYKEDYLISTNF